MNSDTQDRAYLAAMARLCDERGLPNLAASYRFHADKDCPRGCGCVGCTASKAEVAAKRARAAGRRLVLA